MQERCLRFENHCMKVWSLALAPKETFVPHQEYTTIVLSPSGHIKNLSTQHTSWCVDQALWIEPASHLDHLYNTASHPIQLMVIELKGYQQHPLPSQPID